MIGAAYGSGNAESVFARVSDSGGVGADRSFHLTLLC
jgi:hypothetical protein